MKNVLVKTDGLEFEIISANKFEVNPKTLIPFFDISEKDLKIIKTAIAKFGGGNNNVKATLRTFDKNTEVVVKQIDLNLYKINKYDAIIHI